MTNEEKYKTAEERFEAFTKWCKQHPRCVKCELGGKISSPYECPLLWLALEAEETKPEPCYGCGRELTERDIAYKAEQAGEYNGWSLHCTQCGYRSPYAMSKDEAVAAHNRVARAVRAARENDGASEPRGGKPASTQPAQPVRPTDVEGGVDVSYSGLTTLPLQPENVGGSFDCHNNALTSLDGAPVKVGGSFDCHNNNLTSLDGAPVKVGGSFYCEGNQLTSLDGAPVKVGGYVDFGGNSGLTQQQIDDYVAFLKAGGNDPAHVDATGHYCEKARESEARND